MDLILENNIYQLILEFFSAMQYQQSKKEKERTWNSEKAPTSYQFIPKSYDWICSYHYKTKITKLGSMLVEGEWRSLSNDTAINRYNSSFFVSRNLVSLFKKWYQTFSSLSCFCSHQYQKQIHCSKKTQRDIFFTDLKYQNGMDMIKLSYGKQ